MTTLFGPDPHEVTPEMLATLPANSSRLFRAWVEREFARGRLSLAVKAAIKSGNATTAEEALAYMNGIAGSVTVSHMVSSDLQKGTSASAAAFRRLRVALGLPASQHGSRAVPYRRLGIYGHAVAERAATGQLPISKAKTSSCQLSLWQEPSSDQLALFDAAEVGTASPMQAFTSTGTLRKSYRRELEQVCTEGRTVISSLCWHQQLTRGQTVNAHLRRLLRPLVGEYVDRLRGKDPFEKYLELLTLLTWAGTILSMIDKPPRILFSEVRLCQKHDLGRVDAMEVTHIRGKPPTLQQQKTLLAMSRTSHPSSGTLLATLVRHLGPDLTCRVTDWKQAIGDHPEGSRIIKPTSLTKGPFTKHTAQVEWYLAGSKVDAAMQSSAAARALREDRLTLTTADLVYCLPGEDHPIIHTRITDPERDRETLENRLIEPWSRGIGQAALRETTNRVIGRLVDDLNQGKSRKGRRQKTSLLELDVAQPWFPDQALAAFQKTLS